MMPAPGRAGNVHTVLLAAAPIKKLVVGQVTVCANAVSDQMLMMLPSWAASGVARVMASAAAVLMTKNPAEAPVKASAAPARNVAGKRKAPTIFKMSVSTPENVWF